MQFASLMERGYTLAQVMELLNQDYAVLLKRLEHNESLQTIILHNTKGKFHNYLSFFINLHTLHDAIYSSIHMVAFEKQLKHELYKKTIYPLFIFVVSFFTIYLFSNYVIPQLLSSFDNTQNQLLYDVLAFIKNGSILLMMLFLILLVSLFAVNKVDILANLFYLYIVPHSNLYKDFISYYLCGYLKTLHERGLSSRQSIQFLCELKGNRYLVWTINKMNRSLTSGEDMLVVMQTSKYLSKRFKTNFMIASHNGEFEKTLASYMTLQKERWFYLIKKISILVQCISYIFIGILVICVYQIMLIPLQMIEGM